MTEGTVRAAIYGRQSHGDEKSIDEQTGELLTDARAEGFTVALTLSDPISASRHARKKRTDWPKLLDAIRARQIDVVCLWEPSRGDRSLTTWSEFLDACRDNGVRVRVFTHNRLYDLDNARDWRALAEDGVDSAYESEKTKIRVRRGIAGVAAAGKPHGPTRYGYERVYAINAKGKRELVEERPHPDEALIVHEIVERIGRNDPVKNIATDLERRGVPAPSGGTRWYPSTVRHIALQKAYIGIRVHNGEHHKAIWPQLVTEKEHNDALLVLGNPKRKSRRPGRQRWLLSYLCTCAECGRGFHGIPSSGRYVCEHGCTSIDAAALDEFVSGTICRYLARPGGPALYNRRDSQAALAARGEVVKLQARLEEWRDSAAKGETSPASLARIEAQLLAEIAAAERTAVVATVPAVLVELLEGRRREEIRHRFDALAVPARREVIATVAEVRVARAGHNGRAGFDHLRLGGSRWIGDPRTWGDIWEATAE